MNGEQDIVADIIDFQLTEDPYDAPVLLVRRPRSAFSATLDTAALSTRDVFGDAGVFRLEAGNGVLQLRVDGQPR